jgi:hypothetical protein
MWRNGPGASRTYRSVPARCMHGRCNLFGDELRRREMAQAGMRPDLVVMPAPRLDHGSALGPREIYARSSVLRRHPYVIFRMAHYSDASSFVPNLNHGMFTGSKSSFRLLQGSGIRRAFNNFRAFDFLVFAQ